MATRSERVDEAFEVIAGHESVLEVLSLNDVPLRRAYFQAVTEIPSEKLVKALAKLANQGMLEETDGLLFRIVSKEEGEEVRSRIDPGRQRQIHEDSLAWAMTEEDPEPRFVLGHMLGAERFAEAGKMALDLMAEESDAFKRRAWAGRLKQALDGLLEAEDADPQFVRTLAVAFIECSGKELKRRDLNKLNSRLKELDVSEDDRLLFDALVEQASAARDSERAAAKAAAAAAAAAETAEGETSVEQSAS